MRRRIIEALTYPRILLMSNLDIDECPQNGYFNPAHPSCHLCDQGEECHWLNCNDEFTVLAGKPIEILYESLLFSIDYVDAQSGQANHNVRRCACESCHWVRKARRLAWEYRSMELGHSKLKRREFRAVEVACAPGASTATPGAHK